VTFPTHDYSEERKSEEIYDLLENVRNLEDELNELEKEY